MTTPASKTAAAPGPAPRRRRNAADSRQALLEAARELFAERGFDRSTTRDIGERAGLDPTLITRYFGSKAALYLATLRTDFAAEEPGALRDLLEPDRMPMLLDRIDRRGTGPIYDAALRPHSDPVVDAEARALLTERFIEPLERRLGSDCAVQDARLRAELITAAFIGVAVGRSSGAFAALTAAPSADVAALLAHALGDLRCGPEA
jgi:AcrR family transcriptional regulator